MEEFKRIEDVFEYVKDGIKSGRLTPEEVRKIATIKARQGREGEKIKTILPSGLEEVKGTVTLDETTGRPGWIATNPGGEEYIIPDSSFQKMYEEIPEKPGEFRKTVPVLAVKIGRNKLTPGIVFTNKYGEEMRVEGGGYLVFYDGARGVLGKGTYGVAEEAWDTYESTGKSKDEALEESMDMLGLDYVKGKDGEILRGIEILDLPVNVEIALKKAGITTIYDLTQLTEYELLDGRDAHTYVDLRRSLDGIEKFLAEQGLSLQSEEVQGRVRLEDERIEKSLMRRIQEIEAQLEKLPIELEQLQSRLDEHRKRMIEHGATPKILPEDLATDIEARKASEEFDRQIMNDNSRGEK